MSQVLKTYFFGPFVLYGFHFEFSVSKPYSFELIFDGVAHSSQSVFDLAKCTAIARLRKWITIPLISLTCSFKVLTELTGASGSYIQSSYDLLCFRMLAFYEFTFHRCFISASFKLSSSVSCNLSFPEIFSRSLRDIHLLDLSFCSAGLFTMAALI